MHPADVAEHVADAFAVLRDRLAEHDELCSSPPVIEDDVKLYLPFDKIERQLVEEPLNTGFTMPDGSSAQFLHRVPLLGTRTTRPLLLHMDLTDFDGHPPTAELLLPDRSPLPQSDWPKSLGGQGIVVDGHPDYERPFFCRRGLREYHSHPWHEDDPWDKHREALTLDAIVLELLHDLRSKWIGR